MHSAPSDMPLSVLNCPAVDNADHSFLLMALFASYAMQSASQLVPICMHAHSAIRTAAKTLAVDSAHHVSASMELTV